MEQIKYYEQIALFYQTYFGFIRNNNDIERSIYMTHESYYMLKNEGQNNLLVNMLILMLTIQLEFDFLKKTSLICENLFKQQLILIDNIVLRQILNEDEIDHFNELIFQTKYFLKIEKL